ncbi:Uncharacterised protein [Streptococcus pneumoniae]|nr:Uncharacterised protein [Streptococcus pneumoniae]
MSYFLRVAAYSATAVKRTSVEELRAVSHESWMTPITKPTPTTCMAISLEIPKRLQATGIRRREPPAIPEAPQAEIAATTLRTKAVAKSTGIPRVLTAARVKRLMVIATPAILIVEPSGIETE